MKLIKKSIALTLAIMVLVLPLQSFAVPAPTPLTNAFTQKIVTVTDKAHLASLLMMFKGVSDKDGLQAAYVAALGSFVGAGNQDTYLTSEYGLTIAAARELANLVNSEGSNLTSSNLLTYLSSATDFKAAINDVSAFEAKLSTAGITVNAINNGFAKLDAAFLGVTNSQVLIYSTSGATTQLQIDATVLTSKIATLNTLLAYFGKSVNYTQTFNSLTQLVNFYNSNSTSNSDRSNMLTYLTTNGIAVAASTGGTTPTTPPTAPTGDAQSAVDTASKITITAPVTGGVQAATVTSTALTDALAKSAAALSSELKAIEAAGTVLDKELEKHITIDIPAVTGTNTVDVSLPAADVKALENAGVGSVSLKSSVGAVEFSASDILSSGQTAQAIKFSMTKVDAAAVAGVPAGAVVVDFSLKIDGAAVTTFNQPIKVSVPYVKKAGDVSDTITVYFLQADGTTVAVGGVYNETTGMVEFTTNHFSKYFAAVATPKQFSDVATSFWGSKYISVLASKGIINGRVNGTFDPNANITRAEFVALIARSFKLVADGKGFTFSDVASSKWYAKDIEAAYDAGFIKGQSATKFAPDALISRQEASVVISNVLNYLGYKAETKSTLIDGKFTDVSKIASWAKNAVATTYRKQIISGKPGNIFDATGNATRAEVAKMIYQLYFLQ